MICQTVEPRRIGSFEGIVLILAMAAGLFAVSFIAQVVQRLSGFEAASLAVWLMGVLLALYVMRRYLRGYRYTLHEGSFYVERLFGKQSRILMQIALSDVDRVGEKSELLTDDQKIWESAVCARNDTPEKVLAYRVDNQIRLLAFQPNEELLRALKDIKTES